MKHQHTVIWLDHHHATVMHLALLAPTNANPHPNDLASLGAEASVIQSHAVQRKLHLKAGVRGDGRAPVDHQFFEDIVTDMGAVEEILIVGPGTAKTEFASYLDRRHPQLALHVVGRETVDHPTERELLDLARRTFNRIDSLRATTR